MCFLCAAGFDFFDEALAVESAPTIYAFCQHCGSFTYLEFPHLFTDEVEPEEMYGERQAVSRKEMLRDILQRQLERVEAMPEY